MDDALPTDGILGRYRKIIYKMQVKNNALQLRVAEFERAELKRKYEAEMDIKDRAIEEMKIRHKTKLDTIEAITEEIARNVRMRMTDN